MPGGEDVVRGLRWREGVVLVRDVLDVVPPSPILVNHDCVDLL